MKAGKKKNREMECEEQRSNVALGAEISDSALGL